MKRFLSVVMAVIGCCANCGSANAAVQSQFDVPGIGMDMPLESVSFSMVNYYPATSTGTGRPKAELSDMVITRQLDSASPQLAQAAVNGTFFSEVEVHFCKSPCGASEPYLKYRLSDAIISSYNFAPVGGGLSRDTITITFTANTNTPPLPHGTPWGVILPHSLPVGGTEPYQFDFVLDGPTVEALFNRPLSPLGDGLPPTLLHVGVPEPGTVWLLATGLLAVGGGRRRRR